MTYSRLAAVRHGLLAIAAAIPLAPASAQLVVSNLVVDLLAGKDSKQDVEVWNNSADRAYVAIEPAEVMNPGTGAEARRTDPDPEKLGLLVSPSRMILDPGQRKLIRIAEITPPRRSRARLSSDSETGRRANRYGAVGAEGAYRLRRARSLSPCPAAGQHHRHALR
jgi:P pilus assembly chaperone PapD